MRLLGFNEATNTLRLMPQNFEDLYVLARIINKGDIAEARTFRRFRASEGEEGEQKEIMAKIGVEKVELDKLALRLRLTGKIISAKPEQYASIGSYHTLNIGIGERLELTKQEWPAYIREMIKEAVENANKPRLAVVALDEEKASIAYVRGSGIDMVAEIYSKLSKKMREKEYAATRVSYFNELIKKIREMPVDIVIVAGPGFTKDDLKSYIEQQGIQMGKKLIFASASDAERSGIKEALQSPEVAKFLEHEKVKKEFKQLNLLLKGLSLGAAYAGKEQVRNALSIGDAGMVLVNDSVINEQEVKELLDLAYKEHVPISIFNADDDAGMQLAGLGNIAALSKQLSSLDG